MNQRRIIFLCLLLLLPSFTSSRVAAATLNVCPSGCSYDTIQGAINDAAEGDTVLVGEGTYKELIDFGGKAVTLRSVSGPARTIIDGEGSGRVLSFVTGESRNTVVEGFTVRGGYAIGGGGVYCRNSSPTLINCVITDNNGRYGNGGGVYCDRSNPQIVNCRIINNTGNFGGGMYLVESSPEVTGCIISGNSTSIDGGGGGVYCYEASHPIFTNCLFSGNTAKYGGAIECQSISSARLKSCTVSGNRASAYGGGIYCSDSNLTVHSSILWGNTAGGVPDQFHLYCSGIAYAASNIEGITDISSLNVPPLFVDPRPAGAAPTSEGDYHLQAASPCRDAGIPYWSADNDVDGDPRPYGAGYDIGFDEYTESPWSGAADLGNGWCWLDWFGYFNDASDPWIYHMEHGWLYRFGTSTDSLVFWDSAMGALWWTSDAQYPYLRRFSDEAWIWYSGGVTPERWFSNLTGGGWEQH